MPPLNDSSSGSSRPRRSNSAQERRSSAPAGTVDMAVSESTRRRRNRDMDDAAAGRGRRVGDIRAAERAERAARSRRRYLSYIAKIAGVIAGVLIIVFGSILIYRSNLLAVTSVTVSGVENGLRASMEAKTASAVITGPQLWVEALKANSLNLVCDASGLAEGTYQLPIICQVAGSEGQTFSVEVVPETMAVTISGK